MTGESARQTVVITNPQGFHMRPMAAFVETANRYPCGVLVTRAGMAEPVNGKSILSLMSLVAVPGTELVIEVNGPRAAEALHELVVVFSRNYEDEPEPGF
jgi:phosphocarrier protein HPr